MTLKPTPTLLALSLIALATNAHAETERQLVAHEHGAAQLTLAVENLTLAVSLDSPAYNLVGFEHAPSTDAQRAGVKSAIATLAREGAVLDLPAAAQCELVTHQIDAGSWAVIEAHNNQVDDHHDEHEAEDHEDHEDHEDEHHDEAESAHSDVLVEWTYRCENPEALQSVTVTAFEYFPNLTDLQVQYIGDDWQGGAQLAPGNTRLDLN